MENFLLDSLFWEIQLLNNPYIALAVKHISLSEYMEEKTGYKCEGNEGRLKKYHCPFCGEGYIYIDDLIGFYTTEKCNKYGRLYDLKGFLENLRKEKVASELEQQGKLLEARLCPKIEQKEQIQYFPLKDRHFKVGLSFSGKYRDLFIAKVADRLTEYFDKKEILYDKFLEEEFSIRDLDNVLPPFYKDGCDLVAVFLCEEYAKSDWCQNEWTKILWREGPNENLILFHFEKVKLPGFDLERDGSTYLTVSSEGIEKAVRFIKQRYDKIMNQKVINWCNI